MTRDSRGLFGPSRRIRQTLKAGRNSVSHDDARENFIQGRAVLYGVDVEVFRAVYMAWLKQPMQGERFSEWLFRLAQERLEAGDGRVDRQ